MAGRRQRALRWRGYGGVVLVALACAGAVGAISSAHALEWGLIDPGVTAMEAVRARHGEPTRTAVEAVEGYNTTQWVYEGDRAPVGMERMVVDFGLLTPQGYRPQIVRSMLLHPKPGAFTRQLIVQGWGVPTAVGKQGGAPAFMYEEGLFVVFDEDGSDVRTMLFTPRQPIPPEATPPR